MAKHPKRDFQKCCCRIRDKANRTLGQIRIGVQRQMARDKYIAIQENVDACVSADELKTIIKG